jgi:hypothetical protein
VIDGTVEEPLDLTGVEVDAHHAVRPRHPHDVSEQPGRDGLAARRFPVLAGVAVEGADRGDALGRRPLGGVDHDRLLHDRGVHRSGVTLEDEDVGAPHRLAEPAVELAVGELGEVGLAQLDVEACSDLLGQREVRTAAEKLEALLRHQLHDHPLTHPPSSSPPLAV